VESGRVDVGIGFIPARNHRLEGQKLFLEQLAAVVPQNHRLAKKKHVQMSELVRYPLVMLCRGFCTRELVEETFGSAGLSINPSIEVNSIDRALEIVAETETVTLLPDIAVDW
jgi:LysR family cyn operon transcriptional activator